MERIIVEFHIDGASPPATRLSDLANVMLHLDKMVASTAEFQEVGDESDVPVSLVAIGEASNKLVLSVTVAASLALQTLTTAIERRDYSIIPPEAYAEIQELQKQARSRNWPGFRFTPNEQVGILRAVISPDYDSRSEGKPVMTRGTTVIYGRCVRVGGEVPKASIRLSDGHRVGVNLTEPMAKTLARSLYEEVGIEGEAVWNDEWQIESFKASSITPYRSTDPVAAFEQVAKASRGRWNGEDANEYVEKVRHGVDE